MMKYNTNHRHQFIAPNAAFFVGLMQTTGGFAAELFCIFYLSSIDNPVDVIIKFVALASISKVDDFYASALPDGNRIKEPGPDFKIEVHRRDIATNSVKGVKFVKSWAYLITRFIYKTVRIFYCAFLFYFLPYTTIFLPYIAVAREDQKTLHV